MVDAVGSKAGTVPAVVVVDTAVVVVCAGAKGAVAAMNAAATTPEMFLGVLFSFIFC